MVSMEGIRKLRELGRDAALITGGFVRNRSRLGVLGETETGTRLGVLGEIDRGRGRRSAQ